MSSLTIGSLLPEQDVSGWIRQHFAESVVGRSLRACVPPSVHTRLIVKLLADQVDELLDMDLLELLVSAWLKRRELAALSANAGAGEVVALVEHKLVSSHEPRVQVELNGKTIATIMLKLALELELSGVQLVVSRGRVREVRVGELRAAAVVELEGHEVTRQPMLQIKLPGSFELKRPSEPG